MATKHRLLPFSTGSTALVLLLLFLGVLCVHAQPPSNGNGSNNNNNDDNKPYLSSTNFNPSMAIIIVVIISAFFFLGFFSIYIRQCGGEQIDTATTILGGRSRRPRGLDPAILETFPIMVYSEVKEHKIGKGALECAICLNEFEDDDTIRLLTKCDHVFHQECIDAWLTNHVTCPVCRTNYIAGGSPTEGEETATVAPEPVDAAAAPTQEPPATNQVAISVVDEEKRKEEIREMARIAMRRNGSRRSMRFSRSHSTGHSVMVRDGECLERYTLRLPENVRKDIIAAGGLQRVRSFAVSYGTEGSSRRVGRREQPT
ncbi:hypothetical protein HPP92_016163 [Vanilla planifolia]|uniref:RING-type E3 ubiquitin transferase n=1 Tax=Vanilla planifolia TaxID=51239 RepID=A0A835QMK6_VANPL|nr:hypothetical protein HPP92_016163 [Vanilla planifolia]